MDALALKGVHSGSFATLSLAALAITGSRGAWLGALVGGVAILLVAWVTAGRPRPRLAGRSRGARVALAGAAILVVAGFAIAGPLFATRLLSGDAGRFELWSAAWAMFVGHPITGVGPGAWQGLRALTPISTGSYAVLATSHNSILQVLAETGIVGLIAAAALVLGIIETGRRATANAADRSARIAIGICLASLLAAAVHSLVDTQFHLPAVVLMVMLLVARIDLGAAPASAVVGPRIGRPAFSFAAAMVLVGAVLLAPIDVAMIRAQLGNIALDHGDASAALEDFGAATGIHDLPVYRLGQALARGSLGDVSGAADSLARMDASEPFTFVAAERAFVLAGAARDALVSRIESDGAYDATATVTAALLRFEQTDRARATTDLAAVMTDIPSLVFSTRPSSLFDDEVWTAARHDAILSIGASDPVMAAAVATMAGLPDEAAAQRQGVTRGS